MRAVLWFRPWVLKRVALPKTHWHKKTKDVKVQQELKRRAMLNLAAHSFSTVGYKQTSLDDIAAALAVTKPALYYYAKSKEDILMQCARISLERVELCFISAQDVKGNGLDRIRVFFRDYANMVVSEFGSALMREARRNLTGENQKSLRQALIDGQNFLESIIAEGIKDGSIRNCDSKRVAQVLFSAFNQMPIWYNPKGPLNPESIADEILELIIYGVGAKNT